MFINFRLSTTCPRFIISGYCARWFISRTERWALKKYFAVAGSCCHVQPILHIFGPVAQQTAEKEFPHFRIAVESGFCSCVFCETKVTKFWTFDFAYELFHTWSGGLSSQRSEMDFFEITCWNLSADVKRLLTFLTTRHWERAIGAQQLSASNLCLIVLSPFRSLFDIAEDRWH